MTNITPEKKPVAKKQAKSIEDQIWSAAELMRGNIDVSEYKYVVLGLVFLKYINDKFDEKYAELLATGNGTEEDVDYYIASRIFFVPEAARWQRIDTAAHTPENGLVIDEAMTAIEAANPKLSGTLNKDFARSDLDKHRLGGIIDLFSNLSLTDHEGDTDLFGRVYEYCLSKFASSEGANGGEFYTPASIVRLIVDVLQPYKGRIYDPACGSGGMFVQSAKFLEAHHGDLADISVYGQEWKSTTWRLAQLNLAIRGIDANLGESNGDTFSEDQHPYERFDYTMANPPFNHKEWGAERLADDPRWKYGLPPKNNGNYAWIQHMIHHSTSNGRIGLVLANGALTDEEGNTSDIRRKILQADLVEGIVALPQQLFANTGIGVTVWFFNLAKTEVQKNKVLFVDARHLGEKISRTQKQLSEMDNQKIVNLFDQFRDGTVQDQPGLARVANLADVEKQNWILAPGRYVELPADEQDEEAYEERMATLTGELASLLAESNDLTAKIREQLGALGYVI